VVATMSVMEAARSQAERSIHLRTPRAMVLAVSRSSVAANSSATMKQPCGFDADDGQDGGGDLVDGAETEAGPEAQARPEAQAGPGGEVGDERGGDARGEI